MCTMPSTVSKCAAIHCDVGSRPTARSVPGAGEAQRVEAARRRARSAAPTSRPARSRQAATGSSSSRRQTWRICSPSRAERRVRRRGRGARAAPSGRVGQGTAVQFVVRVVDDRAGLLQRRQLVAARRVRGRGRRAGPGAPGPVSADARAALAAELEHALAEPGGHEVERVLVGVLDARALDVQVEVRDVDELRARAGRRWRRARGSRSSLPISAPIGDDLAGLDVGGEADGEVGEALEGGRVVEGAHAGDATRREVRRRADNGGGRAATSTLATCAACPPGPSPLARWPSASRVAQATGVRPLGGVVLVAGRRLVRAALARASGAPATAGGARRRSTWPRSWPRT